jgi:hypothetical protein
MPSFWQREQPPGSLVQATLRNPKQGEGGSNQNQASLQRQLHPHDNPSICRRLRLSLHAVHAVHWLYTCHVPSGMDASVFLQLGISGDSRHSSQARCFCEPGAEAA